MTSTAKDAGARGADRRPGTSRWFPEPGSFEKFFNEIVTEADRIRAQRGQQNLFGGCTAESSRSRRSRSSPREIKGLVSRVYMSLLHRMPEDHVVIEPKANGEFLARCRLLGLDVPESILNRTLLNVRKAGWHTGLDRGAGRTLSPDVVDSVGFAVEIAIRIVQLQAVEVGLNMPAIDQVLCEPQLRTAFDEAARRISPGATLYDYRIAALAFRKSGRESRQRLSSTSEPEWQPEAPLATFDLEDAPERPCVYHIAAGPRVVFLASTLNLRNRLVTHMHAGDGQSIIPRELYDLPSKDLKVKWFETPPSWKPRRADAVAWRLKVKAKGILNLYARAS
jgi:hypothetical protein